MSTHIKQNYQRSRKLPVNSHRRKPAPTNSRWVIRKILDNPELKFSRQKGVKNRPNPRGIKLTERGVSLP